jgi:hypothetical protein
MSVCINPHSGRLSDQVRTTPHSTDSKNLLEHHLSQRREDSGTGRSAKEALTDLYEPTISSLGPTGLVNLLYGAKVISS